MRAYDRYDKATVDDWYAARGLVSPAWDTDTGLVVDGVAAGFILFTDSNVAIIEGFISNKDAPSNERHKAFGSIIAGLEAIARAADVGCVLMWTQDDTILARAEAAGMRAFGTYTLAGKELH